MRLIGWVLLVLVVLVWLDSARCWGEGRPYGEPKTGWRRTRDGWERIGWWTPETKLRRPALHPTVVALLEMFLALAALIAFSKPKGEQPPGKPKPAHSPRLRRSSRLGPYRFMEMRSRSRDPSAGRRDRRLRP